jgi:hypothetical protein
MDARTLQDFVVQAKLDPGFFQDLLNDPDSIIEGFSEIETKVAKAIDAMSPAVATEDLLTSPSNDHCYQTSCGISSFIEP